eukprot:1156620-Pelagomonas_calceolata.AAC.3
MVSLGNEASTLAYTLAHKGGCVAGNRVAWFPLQASALACTLVNQFEHAATKGCCTAASQA